METINITVKIPKHQVVKFSQFMDKHCEVVEFKILPNTEKMYEADPVFRELNKLKKKAKTEVEKYINDNNNKYI
jgi:hypothetical protein